MVVEEKKESIEREGLGSIQIDDQVMADVTLRAVNDIQGVSLAKGGAQEALYKLFGKTRNPGIIIQVDKANQVIVNVKIVVKYGLNIPEIAREVQSAINEALTQAVDINLKGININIQGITRRE